MIGLLLLVPIGSIATYLEKPDALFLLVKEEEVKRYIKGQAKKSFVFWFLIQSFVLLLFVPLLLATGLDKLAIVAYILVLGVAKGAVLAGRKRASTRMEIWIGPWPLLVRMQGNN